MAGFFLRGAFIAFQETFLAPVPNVIVFQFNPDTMTHGWTQSAAGEDQLGQNPLAVKDDPTESFSFDLAMDARDMIADGSIVQQGLAAASGVYTRIAALEMLQFPVSSASAADGKTAVKTQQVPTVLFVWGPGRIVPVRITELSITEKLYDTLLNPIQAQARVGLRVIKKSELESLTGPLKEIAKTAYSYSKGQRQIFAGLNLANAVEGAIGMLPI